MSQVALRNVRLALSVGVCVLCLVALRAARADEKTALVVLPKASNQIMIFRGQEQYLDMLLHGWTPGWGYLGFRGETASEGKVLRLSNEIKVASSGTTLKLNGRVTAPGPRRLELDLALGTDKDFKLKSVVLALTPQGDFHGGKAVATTAEGEQERDLPMGKNRFTGKVSSLCLTDKQGRQTNIRFEPPTTVSADGELRIALGEGDLLMDKPATLKVTLDLPDPVALCTAIDEVPTTDLSTWFPFSATADTSKASELDMAAWLDAPAGKHGRIRRRGSELVYNNRPIKLWGVNTCYNSTAPEKEMADQRAAFYARYGINAVRLHKYADGTKSQGILAGDSFLSFDPEAMDRMDYFVAALKNKGIYVELSPNFGVQLWPKDLERVPFAKELGKAGRGGVIDTGNGTIYLSKEVQDLQIEQMVKTLQHKNPHTGLSYAEDPVIAVIEIINEESVLFAHVQSVLQKVPTLRQRTGKLFFLWLKAKYGTKEKLLAAWGEKAWNSFGAQKLAGDDWEKGYVVPAGSHRWFLAPEQLDGSQAFRKQRLLDTMEFLVKLQDEFYARFVKAVRAVGYEGEILSSNWQAGSGFSHYANLHSDALVGLIDRHNYFGGRSRDGTIRNASMLAVPGSGSLSSGMQQVEDRPFMLSEWIHSAPNEWGVEGPALIGAYGLGLQGWDVSFMFQNRDSGGFLDRIYGSLRNPWEIRTPQILGVFPAVSRQVLRGGVSEATTLAVRNVHVPSLYEGRLGFEDRMAQTGDVKTFDSDKVPAVSLAATRCVVRFTDKYKETPVFDLAPYRRGEALASSTKQLMWHAGANSMDGFFTMDTPGTKAVVGFAEGRTCALDGVTITPECRYGAIYVTAQGQTETVATAGTLLVVAIARARNTGMKIYADQVILDRGEPPILMEPVKATIRLDRKGAPSASLLDHDGGRTDTTIPIKDGVFTIDGARDKTCYYLVEY